MKACNTEMGFPGSSADKESTCNAGVVVSSSSEVTQSCPTLCDPMDCNLPGSSVRGIFQAGVLEWVAIAFSRGSPNPGIEPGSPAFQADALPSEPRSHLLS